MRHSTRYRLNTFFSSTNFPKGVKWLLISNSAVFVLSYVAYQAGLGNIFGPFALVPRLVVYHFAIWELATYLFLHGGVWHLLFNMLTLWMFGVTLERDWGTRKFLKYYFLCGIGAGLCDVVVNALLGNWYTSTIGASGAIYGVLLAYGVLYPEATILFLFLFPIQAKYFVMIYGAIALLGSLNVNSGVSNVAHLGGMIFGLIYLRVHFPRVDMYEMRRWYRKYKTQRAKKKFQVYMRKHGSGRGPWVN
ncbi:MAG TPA: rhomboid family intramembrane serine protease [Bryobacteraceae bacterium]|jgi:membrane associated rhomboid family serine protease|nr:rhomboid family intramembrane serine protease [Bryobacteraceae bacterium]